MSTSVETASLGARLAAWASSLRYDDLPPEVVARTKVLLLDTLAVGWAGSGAEGIDRLHELVRAQGGTAESSVWSFGGCVPATQAAFVNGAMAAALDYDSVHDVAGAHSDIVVIPAVLALAERGRLSGREFIAAYAAGSEVQVRLTLALQPRLGWFYSSVLGVFGAAAGAARALGLDAGRTRHAMGAALSRLGTEVHAHQHGGSRTEAKHNRNDEELQACANAVAGQHIHAQARDEGGDQDHRGQRAKGIDRRQSAYPQNRQHWRQLHPYAGKPQPKFGALLHQ